MKKRKFATLCSTALLSLSLMGGVMASTPELLGTEAAYAVSDPGNPEPNNVIGQFPERVVTGDVAPDHGTLTVHKYYLGDKSKGEEGSNGLVPEDYEGPVNPAPEESEKATFAANAPSLPAGALPVRGVEFEILPILELWKITDAGGGNERLASQEEQERYPAPPGGDKTKYKLTQDNNQGVLVATLEDGSVYTYKLGREQSGYTDKYGIVRFGTEENGLPKGHYFVWEKDATNAEIPDEVNGGWKSVSITKPMDPFVTAIPLTHPDKDKWIQDVHVFPKNGSSELDKEATTEDGTSDVAIGDEVDYSLKLEIPGANTMDIEKITLWDKLDNALDYNNNLTVSRLELVDDGNGGYKWDYTGETLTEGFDYNVTVPATGNDNTLTVELTQDGVDRVTADGDRWEGLAVDFSTIVNKNLVLRPATDEDGQVIKNKATAEFEDADGNKIEHGSNETETPSGEIIIEKTKQDGSALAGAEFKMAASKEAAENGEFIRIDPSSLKLYYPGDDGYDDFGDWIVTSAVTSDGKKAEARFDGLKLTYKDAEDNVHAYDYWGVETKAPKGYNLLKDPIHFGSISEKNGESVIRYSLDKAVVNTDDFKLPETGGMGAILLTILGMIVIGMAFMMKLFGKKSKEA